MKFNLLLTVASLPCTVLAFLPPTPFSSTSTIARPSSRRGGVASLKAVVDPDQLTGFIHSLPSQVDSQWLLTTLQGVADAAATTAGDTAAAVTDAAVKTDNGGWLAAPISFIEKSIEFMHETLGAFGVANSYGLAIVGFTILIKVITLPLNYKQIESTTKMQMIQPMMKEIQKKYKSDPQTQQQKMTQLYADNNVNPLAGCLPALVQIPVFISLYRALTNLAARNELDEPFLWLPSLEGPTYGAGPADGMNWLTKGWEGFQPTLGWHDTIAFLTIPLILIVSQSISQQILQPQQNKDDPATQQSQAILKFLPFMVGYFSLNVPSGLGVYWIANNIITTVTTVAVRSVIASKDAAPAVGADGAGSSAAVIDVEDMNRRGFGKAPPPPPPKKSEEDEEELKDTGKKGGRAPVGISSDDRMGRTEKGSVVEVLKDEGGLKVLREVKDGEVISTTVRLTPEEMRRRKEALERGEDPMNPPPASTPSIPPTNDPRQNKRSKRKKQK